MAGRVNFASFNPKFMLYFSMIAGNEEEDYFLCRRFKTMTYRTVHLFALSFFISLLLCGPALSLEVTKPEKTYRNIMVLENNSVYGVTNQKTKNGKYTPIELTGAEKIKVVLYEFTMKDEVTVNTLKSDKLQLSIIEILKSEKTTSVKILREWLKDKNKSNSEKAAYILELVGNTSK